MEQKYRPGLVATVSLSLRAVARSLRPMSEASPAPGSPAPAESGGAFEPIVPRPGTPSNLEALQQNTALHLTDLIHGVVQSAGAGALEERLARIEARIDSVGALDPQVMERLQQAEARTSSVLKTLQDDVARMQSDLSALAELVTVRVAAVGEVAVPSGFKEGARGEAARLRRVRHEDRVQDL